MVVDNELKENSNFILKEIMKRKNISKLTDIQKKAIPFLFGACKATLPERAVRDHRKRRETLCPPGS